MNKQQILSSQSIGSVNIEQPYFYYQTKKLIPPSSVSFAPFITYLNYRIIKDPNALLYHVQKIRILQREKSNQIDLSGALVDLFIVLKNYGVQLRRRLLLSSKKKLEKSVFDHLYAGLFKGVVFDSKILNSHAHCLLTDYSSQSIGTNQFITKKVALQLDDSDVSASDLIDIAHEFLENSQIDLALDFLETAVLDYPENIEAAQTLTKIYKSVPEKQKFLETFNKLKDITKEELPSCWKETEAYFNP